MEKRKSEDWYDYHQAEWETIAVISNLEKKCYIIRAIYIFIIVEHIGRLVELH